MIRIAIEKKLTMADGTGVLSIDTTIEKGAFVVVYGASGVGKTSLLRCIAGLMHPEKGRIVSDNELWLDTYNKKSLPVQQRNMGFVFQDLALFPNMTVLENLQYAAKVKGKGKSGLADDEAAENLIPRLLAMVGLEHMMDRKPDTLSGGQRQRLALIRALAGKPGLLLLDEPFSALDKAMHQALRKELLLLHKSFQLTTIMVTHDLADVYQLADQVLVMDNGTIVRTGPADVVFGGMDATETLQVPGEILKIAKSGIIYIAEVLTGTTISRLVINEEESNTLRPGMQVLLCAGAFDPVIKIMHVHV